MECLRMKSSKLKSKMHIIWCTGKKMSIYLHICDFLKCNKIYEHAQILHKIGLCHIVMTPCKLKDCASILDTSHHVIYF